MSARGPCMIQGILFTHFDQQTHEARARYIQGALKKNRRSKFKSQLSQQQEDLMPLLTVKRILTLFPQFSEIFFVFYKQGRDSKLVDQ